MSTIQENFNSQKKGDFILSAGEYEGPLTVSRPCVIDGKGRSTLWVKNGTALTISSSGVTVKNLRIEVTEDPHDKRTAIKSNDPSAKLIGVEVNGKIIGISSEAENWNLPQLVNLGDFAANKENIFLLTIDAASDAELKSTVQSASVQPQRLVKGKNQILLKVQPMRNNTMFYGDILVTTNSVIRRIYVTGKSLSSAKHHNDVIPQASETLPEGVIIAKRGQRLSLKETKSKTLSIALEFSENPERKHTADIDAYVFLLQADGKVRGDEDLVYWGSKSPNKTVKAESLNGKPVVTIELANTDKSVEKISVCYSIYGDAPSQTFNLIDRPVLKIFDGERELCRFNLDGLNLEKTVVAMEIYRYKGDWRANFVGSGYNDGLKHLCESFGLEVM